MTALQRVPGKVVAVHVSYRSRAAERGTMPSWPSYFLKPTSALAASDDHPDHPVLRWSVRDPRRRDFWGHPVIPSWYTEATTVLDLDGRPRPLVPERQPAEVKVGADGFS